MNVNNVVLFEKENGYLNDSQKKFLEDITPFVSSINIEQLKLLIDYHKFLNSNNNYLLKNPQYHSEFRNTYNPQYNNNQQYNINSSKQNIGIEHEEIKNDLLNKVNADPRYKFYNSKDNYDHNTGYTNKSIQDFIPSNSYIGSIKGYVFKNDFKGTGYYLDTKKTF